MANEELSKIYEASEVEKRIYELWLQSGFFNPDNLKTSKKSFVTLLPPPNITGSLHMGHALNATIQDILTRMKRMQGYGALWIPGIDHAGIATQNVVEKQLRKDGFSRFELGREKFMERVWQWKEQYGTTILEQLKRMGASCDWSRTVFTMDQAYAQKVLETFIHYYEKGWIYRAKRVINWCPRCQTSLSDLELEYKEEQGLLWHIRYPLKDGNGFVVVATTRPETMLGDEAVAMNPSDERYQHIIGKKVILPIQEKEIPIVGDQSVDPKFGTGLVKVTPAHDMTDYEIALRHNLPLTEVIDDRGRFNANSKICEGLKVEECRQKVVETLKAQGLIEKEESYVHNVGHCYRCDSVIEPIPSWQWFLKMDELAKKALEAVSSGKTKFVPDRWAKVYTDWLSNIRDWCISRQLWWGHRLPVWFCVQNQTGRKSNDQILNSNPENFTVALKKPKKCPICDECEMKQSEDVLDTWFSSALWPFATLKTKEDLERFYPSDVLVTARDIINLWVTRMIFSGREFMNEEPFCDVVIHPTVLTKEGKRMSKSLGTGIDPLVLIEKYGADATRWGIAYQLMGGQDLKFGEENIVMGKKFCNKIWNASRFILGRIDDGVSVKEGEPNSQTEADEAILEKLKATIRSVPDNIERYEFGQAAHMLYDFFWHDFCDIYLEESKKQLDDPANRQNTQEILLFTLAVSLKILHPFIPFITEEIYSKLPIEDRQLLLVEDWPVSHF